MWQLKNRDGGIPIPLSNASKEQANLSIGKVNHKIVHFRKSPHPYPTPFQILDEISYAKLPEISILYVFHDHLK